MSNAIAMTVNTLPSVVAASNAASNTICVGSDVILTGSGATSYSWNNSVQDGVAFTPTATASYTVTGTDANGCQNTASISVTVNPLTTPTFTQVASICVGESLAPMHTTSNNGIVGTWSPALDNTATTTYTFTPATGSCASTTTMQIVVNPIVTPTFTQVAAICSGASLSALPTTSNNGVSGTWSPALDNTTTTTYTFTPAAGSCANTTTMQIVVNPIVTPTFTQVAAICSGASLSALPTTSNNGIDGTWSPALDNTTTTTYTFTPAAGSCASTATMQIVVNPIATPTFTQVSSICAGESLAPMHTTSNNGIVGTWSPALDNTTTTTYTFTPAAGSCANTTTMQIVVNPIVTPTFTQVAAICSGATLSALPTTSNNGVSGTWSPALDNTTTTTYTFIPVAGSCANTTTMQIVVNPIVTPTFTQVAAICSGASLSALPTTSNNGIDGTWSPALDNTTTTTYTFTPASGSCANTATMQIVVNSLPTIAVVASPEFICSGSSSTLSATGAVSYVWSTSATTSSIIVSPTSTTTYSVVGTDANGCIASGSASITVDQPVVPAFTQVAAICTGASLSALPTTSNNGIVGTWSPALNNTTTTTYTFTPAAGSCATGTTMQIVVNALPTVTASAASATVCSGSSVVLTATGASTYAWNNGSTGSTITVSPTAATTYTVTGTSAAGCTGTATVNVGVISAPVITSPTTVSCSGAAVVLTSSLTSGVQWYKTGVLINGATAATYSATSAGTYTVKPTACSSLVSNGIAIVAGTTPTGSATASVQSGNLLLCGSPSQVVLVSNTGITANTGLQWYVNGSAIAGATALTYTATTAGSYDVRRVQLATGCTGIASTPLTVVVGTVPSTPVASVQTGSTLALCSGGTSTFFSNVPPSGSVSLQWFKDGVAQSGATAATFLAGAVGSYTVKATHTSGCASALSNALVLTAVPTAAISSPSLSICDGTAITLTSNVTSNIQWYRGTTLLSGATASTYSATIAGTYTVKSTLCSSQVSNGLVVITGTGPGAPIASTANALVCSGSSVTLNSSVGTTAGASLQWYKDGAAISGATAQAYVTAVAGSYTVRRIAIPSGCLGAASIPVTVINGGSTPSGVANALVAGGGMPLICSSTTNNIVLVSSVAPTASTGLQWYKGTTSTNGTIINGATALTYTATEPGFYSVRRVTPTGCYGAPGAVLSITNGTIPPNTAVVTAINGGGTVVCGTTAVKLQSSVAPTQNATLQWYKDGSPVVNATTQTLSVLSAGSYAVRRITTSCPSLPSNAISVTVGVVPSAPVVSVQSGSLATCPGVSVVLSSSAPVAGTTLQWFSTNNPISNATSETYSTATAGLYRVKATNGICLSPFSNSLTLSVDPVGAASVSIFSGSLTLCNASTVTFKSAHSPTSSTGIRWFKDGVEIAGAIGTFKGYC